VSDKNMVTYYAIIAQLPLNSQHLSPLGYHVWKEYGQCIGMRTISFYVVSSMTLSLSQNTYRQIVLQLVNNEQGGIWKETLPA
jgi:hypothetical protein